MRQPPSGHHSSYRRPCVATGSGWRCGSPGSRCSPAAAGRPRRRRVPVGRGARPGDPLDVAPLRRSRAGRGGAGDPVRGRLRRVGRRPGDHRGRGTQPVAVHDVGHDHRDVVGAAAAKRELHQAVARLLGVLDLQGLLERLGARHRAGQAVGAEQVAVARTGLAHRQVELDALAAKEPTYLFDELGERLRSQAVEFKLVAQIAGEGDVTDNATVVWPEGRELVELGTLRVEKTLGEEESRALQKSIIFDPIPRVEGVEASDDPLLEVRASVYLISGRQRRAAEDKVAVEGAATETVEAAT